MKSIMNEHQVLMPSDVDSRGLSRDTFVFTQDMAFQQISDFFSRHETVVAQHKPVFDTFTSVLSFLKHQESCFQVGHQLLCKIDEMKAEIKSDIATVNAKIATVSAKLNVVMDAVSGTSAPKPTGKSAVTCNKVRNGCVGVQRKNNQVESYYLQYFSLPENKWKRKYFSVRQLQRDKTNVKQFLLKEAQLLKMNLSVVGGKLDQLFGSREFRIAHEK